MKKAQSPPWNFVPPFYDLRVSPPEPAAADRLPLRRAENRAFRSAVRVRSFCLRAFAFPFGAALRAVSSELFIRSLDLFCFFKLSQGNGFVKQRKTTFYKKDLNAAPASRKSPQRVKSVPKRIAKKRPMHLKLRVSRCARFFRKTECSHAFADKRERLLCE